MTVCIGSVTSDGDIVLAADTLLSMGHFSADEQATKGRPLHADWDVLFAADDTSIVPVVLREFDTQIQTWDTPMSVEHVSRCLQGGFQAVRLAEATARFLSPYGLSMPQFLASGSTFFGPTGFALLRQKIEEYRLGCEFLITGFDHLQNPHILTVEDPGVIKDHGVSGYWAIGSGSLAALGALYAQKHSVYRTTLQAVYNVTGAKISAESAIGVGRSTFLMIRRKRREMTILKRTEIGLVRKEWERIHKPKGMPLKLQQTIIEHMNINKWRVPSEPLPDEDEITQSSSATSSSIPKT
jgi:20S proteasome alpha/beta subunit